MTSFSHAWIYLGFNVHVNNFPVWMNVAQNTFNIQGYVMVLLDVKYCKVDVKLQNKRQALFDKG